MPLHMPVLETSRLQIRPFVIEDLDTIHRILDVELSAADFGTDGAKALDARRRWLEWTIMNYDALAELYQPPYGDRAVALKTSGALIGACGFVPCLAPFGQLPSFSADASEWHTPEFGLFYALSPSFHGQGYATEAVRGMIDFAFTTFKLRRIVATTTHDNSRSIAVMRRLGMRVVTNPLPDPPWLQVVGVIDNS